MIPSKPVVKATNAAAFKTVASAGLLRPARNIFRSREFSRNPPGTKNIRLGLHSAESWGKCALHHPGTLPKFDPNYQTLNLERSRGSSGEDALDSVIVAPNSST
jgi:hypothetical protein